MKRNRFRKGAITVEAAVILPFFIIGVMSFAFILKIYFTHEIMQNALAGACRQMGVYGLLYYKTNAEEVIGGIEKFSSSNTVEDTLGDNWLASSIREAGKDVTDRVRAQVALIPAARLLVGNQLEACFNTAVEKGLLGLNIEDGFEGLDFSESRMLADGRSIDISVGYKMRFPFLSGLLPGVKIRQTSSVCIWAGEEGVGGSGDEEENNKSVWDMTNLKRGQEIRKLQGANLPFNFPTVAKYGNGTVTSIKSLNIEEAYYKDPVNLEKKITSYINKLKEFNGGTCGEVSIRSSDIFRKELLLIIPEIELVSNQQSVIDKCIGLAESRGITLKPVKAYGKQGSGGTKADTGESGEKKAEND